MTGTIAQRLAQYGSERPREEAFVDDDSRLTWADVDRQSAALARGFAERGLLPGDVVLLQIPNSATALSMRFALSRAGLIGAYVPLQWRSRELAAACERAEPAAAVVQNGLRDADLISGFLSVRATTGWPKQILTLGPVHPQADGRVEDILQGAPAGAWRQTPNFGERDVSWLLPSSGSTGLPKIIAWPEGAQLRTASAGVDAMELTTRDVVGVFAPLSGYAGIYASLWTLALPLRIVVATDFAPEKLFRAIERERISVVSLVPPILVRLIQSGLAGRFDLSSLRHVRVGTAQFAPTLRAEAERVLSCSVLAAAGSMEAGVFAQCRPSDPATIRLSSSVGRPSNGTACVVVDDDGAEVVEGDTGQLVVRSELGGSGYFRDSIATEAAWSGPNRVGWYHTGDLATITNGLLTLVGRKRDIINRGGNKILPREIEQVLVQHPSVADCAVAGVPDPTMGEVPCAWVVGKGDEPTDVPFGSF